VELAPSSIENGESYGRKRNKLSVGHPARLQWKSDGETKTHEEIEPPAA